MICVTGAETDAEAFRQRVSNILEADLHELRLDYLSDPGQGLASLSPLFKEHKLLVACRPVAGGGQFEGTDEARLALLRGALNAGAWAVDIEYDTPGHLRRSFLGQSDPKRIVLSHHIFEAGWSRETLESCFLGMHKLPAHTLKLAATVKDTAELDSFLELSHIASLSGRRAVLAPMGRAGVVGRICYKSLGSAWTYVAATVETKTAPGQISWDEARTYGLPGGGPMLALIGGAQVHESFGPRTYNPLFRKAGVLHMYVPAETQDFDRTFSVLTAMGLAGAAVTMPHKMSAFERAEHLDASAQSAGAANTLVLRDGWWGYNTDGQAVTDLLQQHHALDGTPVAIVGAGGAARAAVASLTRANARVTLLARSVERATPFAEEFDIPVAPLESFSEVPFDILINATPVGTDGIHSPIPKDKEALLVGKTVLDMVTHPVRTPLLIQAERAGARAVLPGVEMWILQGLSQLELWTGRTFTADEIRAEMYDATRNNE